MNPDQTIGLKFPKPHKKTKDARRKIRAKRDIHDRLDVDWERTRGTAWFKDPQSHWKLDGRLILEGKDMTRQKHFVYDRDKGICQRCGGHVAWELAEIHHIKSKGMHPRNDAADNLETICGNFTQNRCHAKVHGRETRFGESV